MEELAHRAQDQVLRGMRERPDAWILMLGQMPLIVEDGVLGDLLDRVDAWVALLEERQEPLGVSPVGLEGSGGEVMGAADTREIRPSGAGTSCLLLFSVAVRCR